MTPDQIALTVFGLFGLFIVYKIIKSKIEYAKQKAEQEAAWALDYRNPNSVNYDPVRVAAETPPEEEE